MLPCLSSQPPARSQIQGSQTMHTTQPRDMHTSGQTRTSKSQRRYRRMRFIAWARSRTVGAAHVRFLIAVIASLPHLCRRLGLSASCRQVVSKSRRGTREFYTHARHRMLSGWKRPVSRRRLLLSGWKIPILDCMNVILCTFWHLRALFVKILEQHQRRSLSGM